MNIFVENKIEVMNTYSVDMPDWDPPAKLFRFAFQDGTEVSFTANGKAVDGMKGLEEGRIYDLEVTTAHKL